jgi:D-glycerate 3-kinase
VAPLLTEFANIHNLPDSYIQTAQKFFLPLCEHLVKHARSAERPLLVGVHGCQGSGKSTLTDLLLFLLQRHYMLPSVGMSIDDFYLTCDERAKLAEAVHPLLQTRGVPGTHDMVLLQSVLTKLLNHSMPVDIPRFNKAIDDRRPEAEWDRIDSEVKVILLEGWCVGAVAQPESALHNPINDLERKEDAIGQWRGYANEKLAGEYQNVFSMLDQLIMLKAPGFHTVLQWRLEQEQRLVAAMKADDKTTHIMDEAAVSRFIQHYQRITEYALKTLPERADVVFDLDESRVIQRVHKREA